MTIVVVLDLPQYDDHGAFHSCEASRKKVVCVVDLRITLKDTNHDCHLALASDCSDAVATMRILCVLVIFTTSHDVGNGSTLSPDPRTSRPPPHACLAQPQRIIRRNCVHVPSIVRCFDAADHNCSERTLGISLTSLRRH
jgi:hypothetical protein